MFLGLGSNLGDRAANILGALDAIRSAKLVRIDRVSSLYESAPVGWDGGPWYLNAVCTGCTDLGPFALLDGLQSLEFSAGRLRTERNAPRILDLDVLLYGRQEIQSPDLLVPHPRMLQRAFVLCPLAEIAAELPVACGMTALDAWNGMTSHEAIRAWPADNGGGNAALHL